MLFWIYIYYNRLGKDIRLTKFNNWNYKYNRKLAGFKKSVINNEVDFLTIIEESFTSYYQLLIP